MPKLVGTADYPQWVKQKVCDCIFVCSSEAERANALINHQLPTKRGRPVESEPDTMTKAFRALAQCPWEREEEEAIAKSLTRKQFNYIAGAHYVRFLASGKVRPRTRTMPKRELSQPQRELAARILGTPLQDKKNAHFPESVAEVAQASATFRRLASLSGMPLDSFGAYLCETCPDIVKKGKVDAVDDMCEATLQGVPLPMCGGGTRCGATPPPPAPEVARSMQMACVMCFGAMAVAPASGHITTALLSCWMPQHCPRVTR